jgi:hypothetical protein
MDSSPLTMSEVSWWRSFGLHALLLALFYFLWTHRPEVSPKSDPIVVEYSGQKEHAPTARHLNPGSPTRRAAPRGRRSVTLSDLGMRFDPLEAPSEPAPGSDAAVDNKDPQGDGWDLLNPDPKIARFNQYVYNVVQTELDRESGPMAQRLLGTVKVTLWFDQDGNYLDDRTKYAAIDSSFREIVRRSLKRAFARPIPKPFLYLARVFSIQREVFIRPF